MNIRNYPVSHLIPPPKSPNTKLPKKVSKKKKRSTHSLHPNPPKHDSNKIPLNRIIKFIPPSTLNQTRIHRAIRRHSSPLCFPLCRRRGGISCGARVGRGSFGGAVVRGLAVVEIVVGESVAERGDAGVVGCCDGHFFFVFLFSVIYCGFAVSGFGGVFFGVVGIWWYGSRRRCCCCCCRCSGRCDVSLDGNSAVQRGSKQGRKLPRPSLSPPGLPENPPTGVPLGADHLSVARATQFWW